METWNVLQNVWFMLIGILFIGYSILDGFDLGIGSLFPFLSKNEEEKRILFRAIGPFWDGNEVWLLTGAGALFAAFPHAYATVFSGFYLALMVILFSLIFRAVSLEFRTHDTKRQRLWDGTFIVGSFLPSLLYGIALGNVVIGIPLNDHMDFIGNFFTLLRPFPLVIGLLGLFAIFLQGSSFSSLKSNGELQARSRKTARTLLIFYVILLLVSFVFTVIYMPGAVKKVFAWISTAVLVGSLIFFKAALQKGKYFLALAMSSLNFLCLWGIVGAIHFPNLVKASNEPSLSLTIYNASSSELTLKVMLIIALIGMPMVIGYTIYLYRVFKGKAQPDEY